MSAAGERWKRLAQERRSRGGKGFEALDDWTPPRPYELMRRQNCKTAKYRAGETYPSIRPPVSRCSRAQTIAWLADSIEADGCGRPYDMTNDDILKMWHQSPHKNTLGYYGVESQEPQSEVENFNKQIQKSLEMANGPKRRTKQSRAAGPRTLPSVGTKKQTTTPGTCLPLGCGLPFVLNREAIKAVIQKMPTVKRKLSPSHTYATVYCNKPQDPIDPFGVMQEQQPQPGEVEKEKQKRRHYPYCGWRCNQPQNQCTDYEWKKYKLDPRPIDEAFKRGQAAQEQQPREPEPRNYDELFSRLVTCFETLPLEDPLCKDYAECCIPKRCEEDAPTGGSPTDDDGGDKGVGGETTGQPTSEGYKPGDKPKHGHKPGYGERPSGEGDESKDGGKPGDGSGTDDGDGGKPGGDLGKPKGDPNDPKGGKNKPKGDPNDPNAGKNKPKGDPNDPKGGKNKPNGDPNDPSGGEKKKGKKEKSEKEKPEKEKVLEPPEKTRPPPNRPMEAEPEPAVDEDEESKHEPEKPTKKPAEEKKNKEKEKEKEKGKDKPADKTKQPGHPDAPKKPDGKDKPKRPMEPMEKPKRPMEKEPPPVGTSEPECDPNDPLCKPECDPNDPNCDTSKPQCPPNDPLCSVSEEPGDGLEHPTEGQPPIVPVPQQPSEQPDMPPPGIEDQAPPGSDGDGGEPEKPPEKAKTEQDKCPPCPCDMCEFLRRHKPPDSPLMRKLQRQDKLRQQREYYKQMCHRQYMECSTPEYPAPQHKCDPIVCDNAFCRNPKLGEYCECLKAMQDLQQLLGKKHRIVGNQLLFDLEDLKSRLCKRMCDCL